MNFDNRIAVISGAAGRIGRALARELGGAGVSLALLDIDFERLRTFSAELNACGMKVKPYAVDVTDSKAAAEAAAAVMNDFGKVDILVNNAGAWPRAGFLEMEESLWTKVIDLNLNSVFRLTKAFAPGMTERKYGRIINLASIAGEVGLPGYSAYAASKAGVIMLTKTLAMEFAKDQVTVNCVSPGMILDEKQSCEGTWLGRNGTGDEVARAIAFLASDDSGYITGLDLTVDGGRILGPRNAKY